MRSVDAHQTTRITTRAQINTGGKISTRAKDAFINAILFQVCWFMAAFQMWPLMLIPFFTILGHYFQSSTNCTRDFNVMFLVFLVGVLSDTLFVQLGIYSFPGLASPEQVGSFTLAGFMETLKGSYVPEWSLALWAAFATTVTRSLYWMFTRPKLAYTVLTVSGSLAYVAARECGAIEFSNADLGVIFVLWFWITHACRKLLIAFDN